MSGSTAGRLAAAMLQFAVVRSSTVAPAEKTARQDCGPDHAGYGRGDASCQAVVFPWRAGERSVA